MAEPRFGSLTIAEGEELRRLLKQGIELGDIKRYIELHDRCLLYGSEGVEPRAFEGLEPRYG